MLNQLLTWFGLVLPWHSVVFGFMALKQDNESLRPQHSAGRSAIDLCSRIQSIFCCVRFYQQLLSQNISLHYHTLAISLSQLQRTHQLTYSSMSWRSTLLVLSIAIWYMLFAFICCHYLDCGPRHSAAVFLIQEAVQFLVACHAPQVCFEQKNSSQVWWWKFWWLDGIGSVIQNYGPPFWR